MGKKHDDIMYSFLQQGDRISYKLGMIEKCNDPSQFKSLHPNYQEECSKDGYKQFSSAEVVEVPRMKRAIDDFLAMVRESFM